MNINPNYDNCKRTRNGSFSTCCSACIRVTHRIGDCNSGSHTVECNIRNNINICEHECGRKNNGHYLTCCMRCESGLHTPDCDTRNNIVTNNIITKKIIKNRSPKSKQIWFCDLPDDITSGGILKLILSSSSFNGDFCEIPLCFLHGINI